jgi:hypothetical protein
MARKKLKLVAIISAIIIVSVGVIGWLCIDFMKSPWRWDEYKLGNELIQKIEQFRNSNGRLPRDIREVAPEYWDEGGPLYYDKIDDRDYIVWFGLSLGESYTYESKTKEWK